MRSLKSIVWFEVLLIAVTIILTVLAVLGCTVQKQSVRVEVDAPVAHPEQGRVGATFEVIR